MHKNAYQMPNIDTLIQISSQQISDPASQSTTHFSTLELKNAYSHLNLDPDTVKILISTRKAVI